MAMCRTLALGEHRWYACDEETSVRPGTQRRRACNLSMTQSCAELRVVSIMTCVDVDVLLRGCCGFSSGLWAPLVRFEQVR